MSSLSFTLTQPKLIEALRHYAEANHLDADAAAQKILAAHLLQADSLPTTYPIRDPEKNVQVLQFDTAEGETNAPLFAEVKDVSAFVRQLREDAWQ